MVKWSYSGLKSYLNCAKQYYEVKVAQNFPQKDTVHTIYGKEVHKALEDYVKDGTPLPKNYEYIKPVLNSLMDIPGTRYAEQQFALTQDLVPCEFDDPNYWVRGIVDLLIVDGQKAYVIDYKTGNPRYADPKQLKLMALMTFAHHPEVEHVSGGLLFVSRNAFVPEEYRREEIQKYWGSFAGDLERLRLSFENSIWPANPTGLCNFCPVSTCKFHRGD
jgi:CRISPR/Cas system-associated exonuclease Cas4 (RecB family)